MTLPIMLLVAAMVGQAATPLEPCDREDAVCLRLQLAAWVTRAQTAEQVAALRASALEASEKALMIERSRVDDWQKTAVVVAARPWYDKPEVWGVGGTVLGIALTILVVRALHSDTTKLVTAP